MKNGKSNRNNFNKSGNSRPSAGGNSRSRNSNRSRNRRSNKNYQDDFSKRERAKGMREEFEEIAQGKKAFGNDPAWYNRFPAVSNPANSVTFGWPMGQFITLDDATTLDTSFVMPGVIAYRLIPSFGYSMDGSSPLNIATQDLYSTVRKSQTGATNYDPQDMMLYVVAMTNVYAYIQMLQRIYGSFYISTADNRYTPVTLVTAQGANYQSIQRHLAEFLSGINQLIVSAASFNVPASIEYFRRECFLYRDIYIEGDSIKQAMYMYTPASFYQYSEGTEANPAGRLTHKSFTPPAGGYTWEQLLDFGFELIANLKGSQDAGVISGDLGKAFEGNLIQLQFIDDKYRIDLQYSEEVLQQFRNATIFSCVDYTGSSINDVAGLYAPVTQHVEINNTYLQSAPTIAFDISGETGRSLTVKQKYIAPFTAIFEGDKILNVMAQYANVPGVSVATRLMATTDKFTVNEDQTVFTAGVYSGTEIVLDANVYVLADDMTGINVVPIQAVSHQFYGIAGGPSWPRFVQQCLQSEVAGGAFHFVPILYQYLTTSESATSDFVTSFIGAKGDFDTYARIDRDTLKLIHRSAIYSLMMP